MISDWHPYDRTITMDVPDLFERIINGVNCALQWCVSAKCTIKAPHNPQHTHARVRTVAPSLQAHLLKQYKIYGCWVIINPYFSPYTSNVELKFLSNSLKLPKQHNPKRLFYFFWKFTNKQSVYPVWKQLIQLYTSQALTHQQIAAFHIQHLLQIALLHFVHATTLLVFTLKFI